MSIWFNAAPLLRFGVLALVPVIALGAILAHVLNSDVQQRYLDSARTSATLITQVGVQPLFTTDQLQAGLSDTDVGVIDGRLQGSSVSDEVRRLKVWNRAGTIVYSDNHALIGKKFAIDDDLKQALGGQSSASVTDGHDEENAGDNLAGPLVQVYVPLVFKGSTSPSGAFEVYLPYAPVQAAIDRESQQLYAYLAAGLALFYLSMFPIVLLAVRWQHRAEAAAAASLEALERLSRLKTEFLIGIRHQFRTALVGIEGFSELIRDSEQLDAGEVRAFAKDIHDDAQRLDRAFERMLELERSDTDAPHLPPERVDLDRVVNEVVDVTRGANATNENGA